MPGSPDHQIYVAAHESSLVGYVAVHWIPFPLLGGREGYISDLVVRGDRRGGGVGTRLLAVVEERARELGCRRLMLNNRLTSDAFTSGFYAKQGFAERDTYANFVKTLL